MPPAAALPKTYQPSEVEPSIHDRWSRAGAFTADPNAVLSDQKPPYCILIPPPNVTAALHLGHALNNTLQDILVRAHRMMGHETLWMPGTDHAGIATQTVVEKRLLQEEGKRRTDYERDEFIARVQAWKDEYEATITDQLKMLGCSCDWDRQRFTMDDQCASAVRECFFRLFKDSLIYRGKRLVNWDPVTQTALADDEVDMRDVEGSFYYLRYPLVDGSGTPVTWQMLADAGDPAASAHHGADDAWVTVATTRPETYLGDTAIAINPRDPRAPFLRGRMAKLPFVGRVIPIVEDEYVVLADPESDDPKAKYASGFLKVTPAHDPNDYEIGRRHDLAMINVMAPDGSISATHGWDDVGDAARFVGLSREDARAAVVDAFNEIGLLAEVKPYSHSVGHSYRSHVPIEPYLSDQWYVRVTDDRLRGAALRSMTPAQRTSDAFPAEATSETDAGLTFYPPRYAKTFEQWHENLRDWCISRQLWWGHRIPVWSATGTPAEVDAIAAGFSSDTGDGRCAMTVQRDESASDEAASVFVCVRSADDTDLVGRLEAAGLAQDPDVLDTWFSSALWPVSTMGWPDPAAFPQSDGLLEAFNPTSVLTTAREIITLWVSRMVMFNRYLLADTDGVEPGQARLPFGDVFIHAMIQDGEGRKMSKSLGNGVDPRDIIESHGTDALRFTLCKMTTQTQDVRMPVVEDAETGKNTSPKFDEGRNFCNKIWNSARFALSILSESSDEPTEHDPASLRLEDRWMLSRLRAGIAHAESSLSNYEFSVYAQTAYDLHWRDFCDWYLESIKGTIHDSPAQRAVLRTALDCLVRLLHPTMPFITEAIHEHLRSQKTGRIAGVSIDNDETLCTSAWPSLDDALADDASERAFERVREIVETVRQVRAQHNVKPRQKVVLHAPASLLEGVPDGERLVGLLAGVERVTGEEPEGASVPVRLDSIELKLSNLADAMDAGAERARLEKLIADKDKSIAALEKRLNNPGYTDKAPAHLVDQTRQEHASAVAEQDAAKHALEQLS